ncbi:hypothetical protein L596_027344 [Steinernema carpocapsae]|uniref:RNA-directed DNA polymerase n=1 Tax=Steinernema carpocapsae TaxID=34508 RepID=A0A4U5LV76_STECR|nr:hypothetical protein L596_029623 [Steinernema carpocapsae]TKR63526.1 hypothetical protein L596_027344 [Steinernema carpocapsae]
MIPHFQLEIKYIEGKRNVMADALSRAFEPSRAEKSENLDKAVTETVDAVTYAPTARVAAIEITPEKWRNELRTEPKFGDIFRYLQNEILPEEEDVRKTVLAEAPSFCVLDDDLFHVANDGKTTKVVPSQFRNDLLQDTHAGPLGAHMSACKLFELIRKKYFWPNLRADL